MNNHIPGVFNRGEFPLVKFGLARAFIFMALVSTVTAVSAETANFSFEAVLEKIVAPKGEKLSLAPAIGAKINGIVEIVVSTQSNEPVAPHKLPNGAPVWVNAIKRIKLTGAFDALFEGGSVFANASKIDLLNTPYNIGLSLCWGPNSGCTGSGSVTLSSGGGTKPRRLIPKTFRFTHDESPPDLSLVSIVELLASAAQKDKTYLIINLSDLENSSDQMRRPELQARMLWRVLRSGPSRQ